MPDAEGGMNESSKCVFLKELLGLDCQVKFGSLDLDRNSVVFLTAIASVHPVQYPSMEVECECGRQTCVLWVIGY